MFPGNALADFSILDYSNARLISIHNGIARKQNGTFKVIHSIDLEQYENLTRETEHILDKFVNLDHPLRPFMKQQLIDINGLLDRLMPHREKRSIDFIGSAWKWIAGSPDSHDFQILEQKIGNILENNNRQLIINQLISERITEITNKTNEIIKREGWNDEVVFKIERKLNFIEKELQNVEFAIQWAKANIVNSFLLSKIEIDQINTVFEKYNIPTYSIDELLTFGSVKIVTNKREILYILSIPVTQEEVCKVYFIKPIKTGDVIDKIEYEKILECNKELFGIKTECKSNYDITICNRDKLISLRDDNCITNLFKSRVGKCTQINNEHIPTIEEIGSDLLLLNQYQGAISVDNEQIFLNGTYLIKHFNVTIRIDGHSYSSRGISANKPLPAFLQPKGPKDKLEEVISLELLKQLNVKNIERIRSMETKGTLAVGIGCVSAIILTTITIISLRRKYAKNSENNNLKIEDAPGDEIEIAEVNLPTTSKETKTSSIYNIHSF